MDAAIHVEVQQPLQHIQRHVQHPLRGGEHDGGGRDTPAGLRENQCDNHAMQLSPPHPPTQEVQQAGEEEEALLLSRVTCRGSGVISLTSRGPCRCRQPQPEGAVAGGALPR
jgi:hypothetical protein